MSNFVAAAPRRRPDRSACGYNGGARTRRRAPRGVDQIRGEEAALDEAGRNHGDGSCAHGDAWRPRGQDILTQGQLHFRRAGGGGGGAGAPAAATASAASLPTPPSTWQYAVAGLAGTVHLGCCTHHTRPSAHVARRGEAAARGPGAPRGGTQEGHPARGPWGPIDTPTQGEGVPVRVHSRQTTSFSSPAPRYAPGNFILGTTIERSEYINHVK